MKKVYWLRKYHKWLALFVGLQVLIWSMSGLYMTTVNIDIIHGDHLVNMPTDEILQPTQIQPINPQLLQQIAPVFSIELKQYFGRQVYQINTDKGRVFVDVLTGKAVAPLAESIIKDNAVQVYAGNASIESIKLLDKYPDELGGRSQFIWQINYDDWLDSTLYFHPETGQLISKRSDLWRAFDFLWLLHIMDYFGSGGFTGLLFRLLSIASILMALLGSGLLFYRLKGGTEK